MFYPTTRQSLGGNLSFLANAMPLLILVFLLKHPVELQGQGPAHEFQGGAIKNLYAICTRVFPEKMVFVAVSEVTAPPWSQRQIEAEIGRQEATDRPGTTQQERLLLRDARLAAITEAVSGKSWFVRREWVSGETNYRLDQALSFQAPELPADTAQLEFTEQFVNPDPMLFDGIHSVMANHNLKSAGIYARPGNEILRQELWLAWSIEPQFALPVILSLSKTEHTPPRSGLNRSGMFSGFQLDEGRLNELLAGTHPSMSVSVTSETINGVASTRLVFAGKSTLKALQGMGGISYWIDAETGTRLLRVEAPGGDGTRSVSEREEFDTSGFPRKWSSESWEKSKLVESKRISFLSVDLSAEFDDSSVFAPSFAADYTVTKIDTDGSIDLIQNPLGAILMPPPTQVRQIWSRRTAAILILLFVALVVPAAWIVLRSRVGKRIFASQTTSKSNRR